MTVGDDAPDAEDETDEFAGVEGALEAACFCPRSFGVSFEAAEALTWTGSEGSEELPRLHAGNTLTASASAEYPQRLCRNG